MAGEIVYESSLPWDPERPDTTIITCVDGRWYHHFQEFAREHLKAGHAHRLRRRARRHRAADALRSGPEGLQLLPPPASRRSSRRTAPSRIVAIAHQDCAWYKTRKIGPFTIDLRDRQIADLRRVRRTAARDVRRRDGRDLLRALQRRRSRSGSCSTRCRKGRAYRPPLQLCLLLLRKQRHLHVVLRVQVRLRRLLNGRDVSAR